MKISLRGFLVVALMILALFAAKPSAAQTLESPQLQNGDWWKVRVEIDQGIMSRSTCFERYDEYTVKIIKNHRRVFAGDGTPIPCPEIANRLFGLGKGRLGIPFPLELNKPKTWDTDTNPFDTITVVWTGTTTYPVGDRSIEVYELTRTSTSQNSRDVYTEKLLYSKECKCNIVFDRTRETPQNTIKQKQTVIDFYTEGSNQ